MCNVFGADALKAIATNNALALWVMSAEMTGQHMRGRSCARSIPNLHHISACI